MVGDRGSLRCSVEARRERGEDYSLWAGLTRRFEVTYVVGTESDLLGVRALRGDILYLYPSKASPDQAREMLTDMLRRAQALEAEPEFYNTVANTSGGCWRPICRSRRRARYRADERAEAVLVEGVADFSGRIRQSS